MALLKDVGLGHSVQCHILYRFTVGEMTKIAALGEVTISGIVPYSQYSNILTSLGFAFQDKMSNALIIQDVRMLHIFSKKCLCQSSRKDMDLFTCSK